MSDPSVSSKVLWLAASCQTPPYTVPIHPYNTLTHTHAHTPTPRHARTHTHTHAQYITIHIFVVVSSGTRRERGLLRLSRSRVPADDTLSESTVYHLPFVMKWIKRWTWTRFVPVCPTFTGFRLAYRKIRTESSLTERLQGR